MANKTFNTRVISKHDTETNWNKATNFVPLAGEIIIYDQDTNNPQRIKIGDGTTTVINLPFVVNTAGEDLGLVKTGGDVTITNGTITVNDDSHNHTIANIDDLQTTLNGKANSSHTHNYAGSNSEGGSANSAVKLTTARTINVSDGATGTATEFDGTKDISIPITEVKEAYLSWGGKNLENSYSPIDAAMIPTLGANRFAYAKPVGITIEYTRDGSTWIDYEASDEQKLRLTTVGTSLVVGKPDSTTQPTADFKLRVTFSTKDAQIYTVLNKFAIYCSTIGSGGCTCKIQIATHAAPTNFIDKTDKIPIGGFSGWNIINVSPFITYYKVDSQYEKIRFIFEISRHTIGSLGNGLTIHKLYGYGGVGWGAPSNLALHGTIYTTNYLQNAIFPADVIASNFIKQNSSNSYVLLGGGGTKAISDFAMESAIPTKTSQLTNDSNFQNATQVTTAINAAIGTTSNLLGNTEDLT